MTRIIHVLRIEEMFLKLHKAPKVFKKCVKPERYICQTLTFRCIILDVRFQLYYVFSNCIEFYDGMVSLILVMLERVS